MKNHTKSKWAALNCVIETTPARSWVISQVQVYEDKARQDYVQEGQLLLDANAEYTDPDQRLDCHYGNVQSSPIIIYHFAFYYLWIFWRVIGRFLQ